YLFLTVFALIAVFPFYYMIVASLMPEAMVRGGSFFPDLSSLIESASFNYSNTIARLDYARHVDTTLIVAFSTTILQLLTTILAAFAFAKLEFKGRDVLFIAFIATMMIPGELLALTNYVTMSNLGLVGPEQNRAQAIIAMVLPLISSSFYIFLLRENIKQIPDELYLAARIDGKGNWEYLWKVVVPMVKPTLITIGILSLISSWNSYVWPSLAVYNIGDNVISVMIRAGNFFILEYGQETIQYSWQMAASVVVIVPLLALFIIFRRYIMSGTGRAGIKG
ncbi:MAG: carbohydrate ABC transporter permease, partial [Bacilli bacterium]|nr:carbohydrate ABC transporter permease [Bacilli bacterium]